MNNAKLKHGGGDFRDFLDERGSRAEAETRALKLAVSLQLKRLLEESSLTKADMAVWINTSRAAMDRLLDESNPSLTLHTLCKAARVLGCKIRLDLDPA